MSTTTTSGRLASAISKPRGPSSATSTWCPHTSSSARSALRASGLSSITSTRRGGAGGTETRSAGPAATAAGAISGSDTTNSLPRPTPSLVADTRPPCSSTRRCTSVSPSPRPPRERRVGPHEQLEDVAQHPRGDAHPRVAHPDHALAAVARDRHLDPAACGRVLERVVEQVEHDLLEARAVTQHLDRLGLDRERDVVLLHAGIAAQGEERLARDLIQVDAAGIELDPPGEHARDVEQVVDQVRQMAHLALDDGALAGGLLGRGAGVIDHLQRGPDGAEAVAQLVPEHGEELFEKAAKPLLGLARRARLSPAPRHRRRIAGCRPRLKVLGMK